jgi:hypothetical protein
MTFAASVPAAALFVAAWQPWVVAGRLAPVMLVAPLAALLMNLSAAGGISFPGVAINLWLLLVLLLAATGNGPAREQTRGPGSAWPGRSTATWALAVVVAILAAAAYWTDYRPVLHSEEKMAQARLAAQQGRLQAADQALLEAARRDPFAAQPWEQLAALRHLQWTHTRSALDAHRFQEAAEQMLAHQPRSSRAHHQLGDWQLAAYRLADDPQELSAAIASYRRGVELHPNDSRGRAQLAWALHLANDSQAAAQAELALQLDALNPHGERKLARQQLFDPGPSSAGGQLPPGNAEQLMQSVRTR